MVLMATVFPPPEALAVGGEMGIPEGQFVVQLNLAAAATTVLMLVVQGVKESVGGVLNNRLSTGKISPCTYLFIGAPITVL